MKIDIAYITETASLERVRRAAAQSRVLGVDCETTSLSAYTGRMRTFQLSTVGETHVLDVDKLGGDNIREAVGDILLDRTKVKVMQNGKFDIQFMHRHLGTPLKIPTLFDTHIASQLLTAGQRGLRKERIGHGLGEIAERYLGLKLDKKYQNADWKNSLFREQLIYAGLDSYVLIPLYRTMSKELQRNQLEMVAHLEFECIEATAHLEMSGFLLDKEKWLEASRVYSERNTELGKPLRKILGEINFNSPQQVVKAFDERLGIRAPSANKEILKDIAENWRPVKDMFGADPPYDCAKVIFDYLEYKKGLKAYGTYGPSFFQHINSVTGRVHSSFNQNFADTGRYSSNEPNLQNIPHEAAFRKAFVAPAGRKLVVGDWSQIELRIIAETAGIVPWIEAFLNGDDLHQLTADKVGVPRNPEAKIINFGSAYGMGAPGYARKAKVSRSQAEKDMRAFYKSIDPYFSDWLNGQVDYFKQHNLVRSASGRMRVINEWHRSDDDMHHAKQASRNFPIQATSADILKTALVMLMRVLPSGAMIVNIVHDEIVVECDEAQANEVSEILHNVMVTAGRRFLFRVPVLAEITISDFWTK